MQNNQEQGFQIPNKYFWILLILFGIVLVLYYFAKHRNIPEAINQNKAAIEQNETKLDTNKVQSDNVSSKAKKASKRAVKRAESAIEESNAYTPTGNDSVAGKYLIEY